ncbi:MAG: hypothetical protein HC903_21075 [Methylacidiphilales bacterium]|nr:hypothetical protein [Candidatus Methylacidiphilales bacterium]NJR19259.1 hypothetical protein [Calothrix sp. CSU_2_0]
MVRLIHICYSFSEIALAISTSILSLAQTLRSAIAKGQRKTNLIISVSP